MVFADGWGSVSTLYSRDRGQGHARIVMERIIQHADHNGLKLELTARPFGDAHGLNNSELIAFYEKFGFHRKTLDRPSPLMVREPSQETPAL
jgi:GNAT superfamily N-acetyltransferase